MRRTKRVIRYFSWIRFGLLVLIAISLVWLVFFSGYFFKKNCVDDRTCFNASFSACEPAKFQTIQDSNFYRYTIHGFRGDSCRITVTLEKMAAGTPVQLIDKFEGKSMSCSIPRERLKEGSFEEVEDILNHCTGPLKEAIYELVIDRMYGLILQNFGEILDRVENDLFKVG